MAESPFSWRSAERMHRPYCGEPPCHPGGLGTPLPAPTGGAPASPAPSLPHRQLCGHSPSSCQRTGSGWLLPKPPG